MNSLKSTTATWHNWSGVEKAQPRAIVQPTSEAELIQIIDRAGASAERVKAVGAGHSFMSAAVTDGTLVNLDKMGGLIRVDKDAMTARLRAGTGMGFTGFAGMVRAFRIVTPDGQAIECSPDAPGLAGRLFHLARISLGAYGVITEVELDVVDTFVLHAVEAAEPVGPVVANFPQRATAVDHFEFYWFPTTGVAHTKTNTRLPGDTPTQPSARWKAVLEDEVLNNGVYYGLNTLAHYAPALTRPMAKLCAATLAQREYSNVAHDVFVSSRRVRFNEMEYAVPLADAPEVIKDVMHAMNTCGERVLFPIEVRGTAGDDVPLSTAKGRESCYIAVHRFHKDDHRALFRHIEPILKTAGGRPHWGKIHTLTHEDLLERHEDLAAACELRAEVDPAGMFRNSMVDRVFGLA